MAKFNIGSINGTNNVIGDKNVVQNGSTQTPKKEGKVLTRDDYFNIILDIRELERISLDVYMEDLLETHLIKNPDFVKILYKELSKVLDGIYDEKDYSPVIESGDFIIERGDIRTIDQPTNLELAHSWLFTLLMEEIGINDPLNFMDNLAKFKSDFIEFDNDTPSYKKRIQELRRDLLKEKILKSKSKWKILVNFNDLIDLNPNWNGFGLKGNVLLDRLLFRKNNE